ncbi:MAG: ABC transporter permease [Longimicrobiales bacterium]
MVGFTQDFRIAFRSLWRSPGFTVVAVLTLALGIGASTAIYTLLERVVLDPLPYPEAERLVRLKSQVPGVAPDEEWDVSEGAWWYFGDEARTLDALAAYDRASLTLLRPDGPARVQTAQVTAGTLRVLGARPAAGRLIEEPDDDPGAPPVAVLSHGLWQREFGGDRNIIGRTIHGDGVSFQVIGVMERGFRLPPEPGAPMNLMTSDLWLPLRLDPAGPFWNSHTEFRTIARLSDAVTLGAAQAELDALTARLPEAVPNAYSRGFMDRYGFRTVAYPLRAHIIGDLARNLWILFGAVGLVLLIAAANVANLFLVRVEGRRHELAVRSALGARRGDVARQLLAESLVLALAGGALAVLIGFWGVEWLVSLAPPTIPRIDELGLDGSIVLFTLGVSLLVALGLASFPILQHGRVPGVTALAEGGRSATAGRERQRVRGALVASQVALALVLIVGAALLIQSFQKLRAVDPRIEPEGVVTANLFLPWTRYPGTDAVWQFYKPFLERVRAIPGVTAAGLSTTLPFTGGFGCTVQGFEDTGVYERLAAADMTTCAGQEPTSPGYFEAMGIPLLRGRVLTAPDHDQPERGSVVVSAAFAERFWPGEDPIGKGVGANGTTNQQFYRVVGVVGDVYASAVDDDEPAVAIYYPIVRIPETSGWSANGMRLVVRTELSDPLSVVPQIRRAALDVDPAIPITDPQEMETIVAASMSRLSFTMAMLGIAATVALLLAAIGLYGVISYVVTRRTNEIGVRIALGAQVAQVERLVVAGSIKMTLVGLAVGLLGAYVLTRLLSSMLYGVEPTDPLAYVAGAILLTAVALAASWLPARRAARVDPVEALRVE